ncbi:hypothetical protein IQ238_26525 [Pleurocapsales cyanobacterium LEGE 06147]|nr:hypothetical protein [Pleurocapsales cyanobacterium LEGE 06147]
MNAEIAQAVLRYYDIPNAQLTFLGQSQNITFRVEILTGDKFLLRLHVGIEAAGDSYHDIWREPLVIQSELLWLNAIAQIEKLSSERQEAIAALFLAELQDEKKWETRFAATTKGQYME